MDADDQKSNLTPRSHPVIYNVTMIGNGKQALTSDNSGIAAIEAKELTEGEIYNSVFANFRYGLNLIKSLGTRTGTSEAYHNWANTGGNGSNSLKIKCNSFVGMTKDIAIDKMLQEHCLALIPRNFILQIKTLTWIQFLDLLMYGQWMEIQIQFQRNLMLFLIRLCQPQVALLHR